MSAPKMHWRSMLDSKTFGVGDFPEAADLTVRIVKVEAGKVSYADGPAKRALIRFQGFAKPYAAGAKVMGAIARLHGPLDPQINWPGKTITIFQTVDKFAGQPVDAVRVRESKPGPSVRAYGDPEEGVAPFDLDGTLSEIAACTSLEDVEAMATSLKPIVPKGPMRDSVKAALDAKRDAFKAAL